MNIHIRKSCLSIVLLSALIEAIQSNENENNGTDVRHGRVNGRIVKLYSGSKPEPVLCLTEGFKADPVDCSAFYRCMKTTKEKYTVFRFQCGPGTVYDPETEVCNHPRNTKRSECGGLVPPDNTNDENEIVHELPSPISTIRPVYVINFEPNNITAPTTSSTIESVHSYFDYKTTTSSAYTIVTTTKREIADTSNTLQVYPWIDTKNKTNEILTTLTPNSNTGFPCSSDGFVGDKEDCRKFYRCISNSRGGFTRYEFSCSESTVWDDNIQSCNHAWAVRNSRCGGIGLSSNKQKNTSDNLNYLSPYTEQSINYGQKVTKNKNYNNNEIDRENKFDYGNKINNNNYALHTVSPDSKVQNGVNNKNISINEQNSYVNDPSNYQTMSISHTTEMPHKNKTSLSKNMECTQTGFMGDSNDCTKFYRCVDNGRGSFKKFEFSCGQGTVWDSKAEACNHAWAVKECGGISPVRSDSTTSSSIQYQTYSTSLPSNNSTTHTIISTKYPDEISTVSAINEDNSYINPSELENERNSSTTTLTTVSLHSTTRAPEASFIGCKSSGFYGDANDCQKFYRCVDNGKGSFIKYEYKCGQGTLWDQDIEACNHAGVVKSCRQSFSTNTEHPQIMGDIGLTTTVSHYQTSAVENNESISDDIGYNVPQNASTITDMGVKNTTPKQPIIQGNECKSTGFIGDASNCKKFYRCVDNGKGGFTQYKFLCGEGTVWDSEIEACNHAWAVEQCGGNKVTNGVTVPSATTSHANSNELSNGYPTQSYDTHGTTTLDLNSQTSKRPTTVTNTQNECKTNGFVGDKNDCKKFYRCVENDSGGFIRYEYLCGEGTVWDPKIQSCNHANEVQECESNTNSQSTTITTVSTNVVNESTASSSSYDNENGYVSPVRKEPDNSVSTTTKRISTTKSSINYNNECKSSGFMGDNNDCKKFYRCVDNDKGGFLKYEFSCGDGTVWDSKIEACNHDWAVEKCGGSVQNELDTTTPNSMQAIDNEIQSTTTFPHINKTTTQSQPSNSPVYTSSSSSIYTELSGSDKENKCTSEGFFANPNNCRKFFRCVNNDKGGYTKFDFDCGEGTVWVQEMQVCDHETDAMRCSYSIGTTTDSYKETTDVVSTQTKPVTHGEQISEFEQNASTTMTSITLSTTSKPKPESSTQNICKTEGFFGDTEDCKKFYRCVNIEKGGYTKYDFTCGEGTIWDQDIIACNHQQDVRKPSCSSEIENASSTISSTTQFTTTDKNNVSTTTEKSKTSTTSSAEVVSTSTEKNTISTASSIEASTSTEKNSISTTTSTEAISTSTEKNTISTASSIEASTSTEKSSIPTTSTDAVSTSTEKEITSTISSSSNSNATTATSSSTPIYNETNSNCESNNSSEVSKNQSFPCEKAGFYANPNDCKKYYRCVDWESNGQNFSIFHFECGEGTIWDPALETCNHENSVYPSRNCKQQNENVTESATTTESISTVQPSTSLQTTASLQTTQETTTTMSSTSGVSTTTVSTTEPQQQQTTSASTTLSTEITSSSSTEQTTSSSTEITSSSSTEQTTSSSTEITSSSSTEQTTSSSTEQTTSSSTEETTSSITEQTTSSSTEQTSPSSTEQTTSQSTEQTTLSSTEQTTSSSTEQTTSIENSTITESTSGTTHLTSLSTDQTTIEQGTEQSSTTESSTTQANEVQNTTSGNSITESESNTEPTTSNQKCPETDRDQSLFVCPTSFRRHPKYCNLFYQCTEEDNHELKVAVFNCPNNTIYDETKIQCVEEEKSDKKCNAQIAQRHRVKRLGSVFNEPIIVTKESMACPTVGHFPFQAHEECSEALLKCQLSKSGKLRGYVYKCPAGFVYWTVSRRCEPMKKVKDCKISSYPWNKRYDLPLETYNIAS